MTWKAEIREYESVINKKYSLTFERYSATAAFGQIKEKIDISMIGFLFLHYS